MKFCGNMLFSSHLAIIHIIYRYHPTEDRVLYALYNGDSSGPLKISVWKKN